MTTGVYGDLVMEPRLDVAALAEIVQEMVDGGAARLHDDLWLRQRAIVAGLGRHERAALEALRVRLRADAAAFLDAAVKASVW